MIAHFCFFTCALLAVQSPDRSEWLLAPRLNQGQELVYRGTVYEEALGQGVQFTRSYRLENRVFVLDKSARGFEVAFYTVLKLSLPKKPGNPSEQDASSVRLEVASLDLHGRITPPPGASLIIPLEGPATVECGAFIEFPDERVSVKQGWEVAEDGRPARIWKATGPETVNGTRCLRLEGVQESDDWEHPRADHTAWRRRDKVWLTPDSGVPIKVERILEKREPAHREPSQRSCVQYELQDNMEYRNQLFEDRRNEIQQACKFNRALTSLLTNPNAGLAPLDRIISLVGYHLQSQPRTPYRDAIVQVKRNAEAARSGDAVVTVHRDDPPAAVKARLGALAPDFVATDLFTKELARLRKWLGHPIVMVFYNPQSLSAEEVLRFAQSLSDTHHRRVSILALAISDDSERVRQQHTELKLSFPVLSGKGFRQTYEVDVTPKLVIIDAGGIIRGIYDGWGQETPLAVAADLRRCVQADDRFKSGPPNEAARNPQD
jgi:peroxiredoxin